jgi:signal transduction histidine kinase
VLRSLNARLIVAFVFVTALAVALVGIGALLLLRDEQQDTARERVGRHAEPLAVQVALMERAGIGIAQIQQTLKQYADRYSIRIIVLDQDLEVVWDSAHELEGRYILSFEGPESLGLNIPENANFRYAKLEKEHLLLFTSDGVSDLAKQIIAGASLRPLVAVPETRIASAWLDLGPRLMLAAGAALIVALALSLVLSRSITEPLRKLTRLAQEVGRGRYDQRIEPRGPEEVRRLAGAFNKMAGQVMRSDQSMRDLLANVSHELKTPLTSIQGFSQAMVEGQMRSPEDYAQAARIIHEEAARMRELVDDLLYLSQMQAGVVKLNREPLDLASLLEASLERFRRRAEERQTALRLDLAPLPTVEADGRRLEQVFANLVDNAIHHSAPGSAVTIRARSVTGMVEVAVHNTGSHIAEEELPRIFERFYQIDRARTRRGGHAGLGLAIAAEVVEAHGGRIEAASSPEEGTVFTVTLPVRAP